jgi:hypothetical protein
MARLVCPEPEAPTPDAVETTTMVMFRLARTALLARGPLLALNLAGAAIGNAGALTLSELFYLPAMSVLRSVDLSGCGLTDAGTKWDGTAALASVLLDAPHLSFLSLARNALGARGALSVARALARNPSIMWVDLSRNNLRSAGVAAIADAISIKKAPKVRAPC